MDETGIMSNNVFTIQALNQLLGTPYEDLSVLTCTEIKVLEEALLYNRVSLVVDISKTKEGKLAIEIIAASP